MFYVIGENAVRVSAYGRGDTIEAAVLRWASDEDHEVKCEIDAYKVFSKYTPRVIRGEEINLAIKFVIMS